MDFAAGQPWWWFSWVGRLKAERAVRSLGVVVVDVHPQDVFKVAAVENEQPVEALRADRSDEAFGDRVRFRRPNGCFHDPDLFAAEHLVERTGVLAVSVADQEPGSLEQPGETQVASLLGNPAAVGIGRAAREPDATTGVLDKEQHVVAAQEQRLDREKVAGNDALRLRLQELAPARPGASRRRPEPCAGKQTPDTRRRCLDADLGEFSADPAMTPAWVLARATTRVPGSPARDTAARVWRLADATSASQATGASAAASAA